MKTAFLKENFRKIRKTKTRFVSLVLIVMLGVLFFSGMNSVSPDMKNTMNKYLKEYNVADIQIISELGFTEADVTSIRNINEVNDISAGYIYDVITQRDGKRLPIRTNSVEKNQDINKVQVLEGRYIENDGECLIDERLVEDYGYKIGDTFYFESGNKDEVLTDNLKHEAYVIVGMVRTPAYISKYYGSTDLENGELLGCVFLLNTEYKADIYTNIYVKTNIPNNIEKLSDEYKAKLASVVEKIESIGEKRAQIRYSDVYNENYKDISDAKNKISDAKKRLSDAKKELDNAKNTLNELANQIYEGRVSLSETKISTENLFATYLEQLSIAQSEIENNANELNSAENEIKVAREKLTVAKSEYEVNKLKLEELNSQIETIIYTLSNMDKASGDYAILNRKLTYLEDTYQDGVKSINSAKTEIENAENEINLNEEELRTAKEQIVSANVEYSNNKISYNEQQDEYKKTINITEKNLEYYQSILSKGRKEYFNKLNEYKEELEKATNEIADKESKLSNAEKKLDSLGGKWYVIGLYDNDGFVSFKNDLEKIGIMGKVFPVMFFIVAALVSITTITRMIEEDRATIATEKALGYSKTTIVMKYVLYAVTASILGITIGTLIGSYVITGVLYDAYRILYAAPDLNMEINLVCILIATLITFITTVLCAIIITTKELSYNTAELMRPKAPKEGKEIFVEKWHWLWERLSFLIKVSIRNIFRYKRRLLMAVIGIAGCTALIYSGLSLKESVDKIANKQYGEIKSYDMQINLDYEMSEEDLQNTLQKVKDTDKILSATYVREKSTDIKANGTSKTVFYLVGQSDEISNYIKLQNRITNQKLELTDGGIIISEKLANTLNVKIGDNVAIVQNDQEKNIQVIGITENYLFNYIYMTPSVYEQTFGEDILYNELLANTEDLNQSQEKDIASVLKEDDKITGITLTRVVNQTYIDSLESLMSIVFLCIGCASLLSFIVLFNLNSINIEERKRELATIKVLGFYDKEVSSYVFRENIILTIIGGVVGLILGTIILGPIMKSGEVETIYLPVELNLITFIISFAITLVFTLITNKIMNRRLKKIGMIDSLKSIE